MIKTNKTMMQYFEWYLPDDATLWKKVTNNAQYLDSIGITSVWLPPAYKGQGGIHDTGYGVYDLYDLGEFDQKGSIPTKYGTKEEYLNAIKTLKGNNIQVFADIVLNHKMGADGTEEVLAIEDNPYNRNNDITPPTPILAWTKYTFPGRNDKYSSFHWNWTHFHGAGWDERQKKAGVYKFYGKHWDNEVDKENGNFDYLMGEDIDLNNVDVVTELTNWGKWYLETTNVDGFRLDAVKHIRFSFYKDWIKEMKELSGKQLDSFAEYWSNDIHSLVTYLRQTKETISLFDVPLHYNFFNASNSGGNYDMRHIFDNTLVQSYPDSAVTFVDNHDTQPGQSLFSWVQDWFKPIAYSLILLRKDGYPCVFYGDYYGIPHDSISPKKDLLDILIKVRKYLAYGNQNDYFDHPNVVGFTREGDTNHADSGLAVLISDGPGGNKIMNVGKRLAGSILYDCTGNVKEPVYVDQDGNGIFYVNGGSVSVWIKSKDIS